MDIGTSTEILYSSNMNFGQFREKYYDFCVNGITSI